MKEYVGKPDPKYGGIVTNICELPVGTTFYVRNGAWTGTICHDDNGKFLHIGGCPPIRIKEGDENYLAIDIIKNIYTNSNNVNFSNNIETVEKINHCSVCKNDNSSECKKCIIVAGNASPNNFLADCSKITPFFIDSYYELFNKYIHLLKLNGTNYKLNVFDIGD